jgi:hypothetical protein
MAGRNFNKFAAIAAALHEELAVEVEATTRGLANYARALAAVRSGFMRNSIYTITRQGGSTYGLGGSIDEEGRVIFPQADPPKNDLEGVAGVAAIYGEYVNYGTRFMAAQPFWEPAVGLAGAMLDVKLGEIEPAIIGKIG